MSEKSAKKATGAEDINWDLSDLYASADDPKLQSDKQQVVTDAEAFADKYRGKVAGFRPADFRGALEEYEDLLERISKIGAYAYLTWTVNTEDSKYGKLVQEANELSSEINQKLVFFDVEWLSVDDEKARQLIESEELAAYRHYLEASRRYKTHILEEKQEQILSAKSVTGRSAWVRYFDETLGSARFKLDGEKLTEQEALSKLHEPDRELRKRAHASLSSAC